MKHSVRAKYGQDKLVDKLRLCEKIAFVIFQFLSTILNNLKNYTSDVVKTILRTMKMDRALLGEKCLFFMYHNSTPVLMWKQFSVLANFSPQLCCIPFSSPFDTVNVSAVERLIGGHLLWVVNRMPQEESYQHNTNPFSGHMSCSVNANSPWLLFWKRIIASFCV